MTKSGMKSATSAKTGMRGSIWSLMIVAVFALMTGLSSSAIAEEVSIKGI
ncbi:MAG: hypothetical protein HOM58_00750 [Rhodospirillaceae bacterium]|nr:hypothetical protein [Rhodospirillaceae bacterium]MBT5459331.1 hypothetical protein [Rhodospirillaceae bacterium]